MKKNNQGFSLIELIVAFAILAGVSLVCVMFINTSSDLFTRLQSSATLQSRSQIAVSQVSQYFENCDKINIGDDGAVHITKVEGTKNYSYNFKLGTDGNLYFTKTQIKSDTANASIIPSAKAKNLLAKSVSEFAVEPSTTTAGTAVKSAVITIKMQAGSKSYTARKVVALRNLPTYISTVIEPKKEADNLIGTMRVYFKTATHVYISNDGSYICLYCPGTGVVCYRYPNSGTTLYTKTFTKSYVTKISPPTNVNSSQNKYVGKFKGTAAGTNISNVSIELSVNINGDFYNTKYTVTTDATPLYYTDANKFINAVKSAA